MESKGINIYKCEILRAWNKTNAQPWAFIHWRRRSLAWLLISFRKMPMCGSHTRGSGLRSRRSAGGRRSQALPVLKQKRGAPARVSMAGVVSWAPGTVGGAQQVSGSAGGRSGALWVCVSLCSASDAGEFGSHLPSGRREVTHSHRGHRPEIWRQALSHPASV